MSDTFPKSVEELTRFAVEAYRTSLIENLSFALEGGQVPGIDPLDAKAVLDHVRAMTEEEWFAMAARAPSEANQLLKTYQKGAADDIH